MLCAFYISGACDIFIVYAVSENENIKALRAALRIFHSMKHIFNKPNCFHSLLSVHSATV